MQFKRDPPVNSNYGLVQFNLLIGPILSPTTTGQCRPASDGNEGALCIPQSSIITGTPPSDCLMSYTGHSSGVLPLCKRAVGVFYSSSRLGKKIW